MNNKEIVEIIGTGTMGSAIATVLQRAKNKYHIVIADRDPQKIKKLSRGTKMRTDQGFSRLREADFVILAVKPQDLPGLADEISGRLKKSVILVSIAAGVSVRRLQDLFVHRKVVRVMPNLGLLVGQGMATWTAAQELNRAEKRKTQKLLDAISENFAVTKEGLIDAITAISGSGPAYFFYFAQGLVNAAKKLGLNKQQARKLVEKTMSAAAALQFGRDYQDLIRMIASKKGTTESALKVFEQKNLKALIEKAARAAYKRAKELSS